MEYQYLIDEFKHFLKKNAKSLQTIEIYSQAASKYLIWYNENYGIFFKRLTSENILAYKEVLKRKKVPSGNHLSGKTINLYLNALNTFNDFLIFEGVMNEKVILHSMFIKIQTPVIAPTKFTNTEINMFFQTILNDDDTITGYRNYAIAKVMALTGCRISECLNIQLSDVHFETNEIMIRDGKGGKARIVYINKQLAHVLRKYISKIRIEFRLAEKSELLFISHRTVKINRKTINKAFTQYSIQANIGNLTPHDLRHHFVTSALNDANLSIHETAALVGHTNINTTKLYTHVSKKDLLNKIDDIK